MEQQSSVFVFLPRFAGIFLPSFARRPGSGRSRVGSRDAGRHVLSGGPFKTSGRLKALTLALALMVPLTAACGKTIGETIDDTTITTRVKTAMLNDPAVGGLRIDVDTFKGVVTLSGRVKSAAERDQAVSIARRVNGVAEVKDALQIIPDAQAAPAAGGAGL